MTISQDLLWQTTYSRFTMKKSFHIRIQDLVFHMHSHLLNSYAELRDRGWPKNFYTALQAQVNQRFLIYSLAFKAKSGEIFYNIHPCAVSKPT